MSTEHYDLAARLRAAITARPVQRSRWTPAQAPREPIALTVSTHAADGRYALTATEYAHLDGSAPHNGGAPHGATRSATGYGHDALQALAALGVGATITLNPTAFNTTTATSPTSRGTRDTDGDDDAPSEPFRTLIVADAATLRRLHTILANTPRGSRWDAQAAVLTWWLQRAEHPGTAAVLDVTATCTARWYTGEHPNAERHPETWLTWHHLTPGTPGTPGTATGTNLLDLATLATLGTPLPGLDHNTDADDRSWTYHLNRLTGGWNFRQPDTRTEAALGLATRCDATELHNSRRLDDPLIADRARFDGTIVTGTLTWINDRTAELTTDRLTSRLRSGTTIDATTNPPTGTTPTTFTATIEDTRMSSTGQLTIALDDISIRGGGRKKSTPALAVGTPVTLRPERVASTQQQNSRRNRRNRYTSGNWLVGLRTPPPTRRDVPWDVVVAAASD